MKLSNNTLIIFVQIISSVRAYFGLTHLEFSNYTLIILFNERIHYGNILCYPLINRIFKMHRHSLLTIENFELSLTVRTAYKFFVYILMVCWAKVEGF